jgi:hypothetical protein
MHDSRANVIHEIRSRTEAIASVMERDGSIFHKVDLSRKAYDLSRNNELLKFINKHRKLARVINQNEDGGIAAEMGEKSDLMRSLEIAKKLGDQELDANEYQLRLGEYCLDHLE